MGEALRNIEDIYPVTPMQEAMLFDALHGAGGMANLEQFTFVIRGPLDAAAYREAWNRVVHRHQALRAKFAWPEEQRPLQAIQQSVEVPWREEDWSADEDPDARLDAFLERDRTQLFDVREAPLMRFVLVRLGPDLYRLIWTFHHILVDAWSVSVVLGDIDRVYDALSRGTKPALPAPRPLRDVVAWIAGREADPAWQDEARQHFASTLEGYDALTPLAFRRLEHERTGRVAELTTERLLITGAEYESMRAAARAQRVTIGTLILAAWSLVLSRHAMAREVVFGANVSARPVDVEGVEDVVGLVMNALPLRVRSDRDMDVRTFLQQVQSSVRANGPYEQTRLSVVQDACGMRGRDGIFDSLVILANYPLDDARRGDDSALSIEAPRSFGWATVPLQFMILPWKELDIEARFDSAEFDPARVRSVLAQLRTALIELAADADRPVSRVPILTAEESATALAGGRGETISRTTPATIPAAFAARLRETPDAVAYRAGQSTLTFRELDARSSAVASALRAAGVQPRTPVGVCIEPGLDLAAALLGVVRMGAAYVPLDPTYPRARLEQIAGDAKPSMILVSKDSTSAAPEGAGDVRLIDDLMSAGSAEPFDDAPVTPEDTAYIIYTSGSTGAPKGVRGTHGGALNRFEWMWRTRPFAPGEATCWCTTINFVDHVWEVFGPMLAGIETVIVPQETVKDPRALIDLIAARKVSRLVVVPALLEAILDHTPNLARRAPAIRIIVSSGEALSATLARRLLEAAPKIQLINLYGSSEVAADVLAHPVTPEDVLLGRIPLGKPIDNAAVVLLDHDMLPAPPGSPGMIYVGGPPLADGYHARADLTAERFFPCPFPALGVPTLFKTGDLARRDEDGVVEYMGRADFQVKVRGFRIELGDVEQTLASHQQVGENVVIARKHGADNRLVAYVVPRNGSIDQADLRRHVQTRLPAFMMPSEMVVLPALPRTPNGKIDRAALPDPACVASGESTEPEPGTVCATMTSLFREVLQRADVGPDHNFFHVGGHSLIAVKLFARIESTFKCRLPLATLMAAPTPRELAAIVESDEADDLRSPIVPIRTEGTRKPFFCVHGMNGDVLFLQRLLAVTSPDQPIYGLQARGMDGIDQPLTSVEDMAAVYERAIRDIQPEGPYVLGGYSLGGMIALEMAHRLAARGEQIERLILLDTRVPRVVGETLAEQSLATRIRRRLRNGPKSLIKNQLYEGFIQIHCYRALQRFGLPLPRFLRRVPTRFTNRRAYFDYKPRPWAGRTTLLRAAHQEETFQSMGAYGWEHIAVGGLDIVPVDCDHNVFSASTIEDVGRVLEGVLAGACEGDRVAISSPAPPLVEAPA